MKRIVMFAAAIVIMLVIIAISIYTINHIGDVNRQRQEQDDASSFAANIIIQTETLSVWDRLREERATQAVVLETDENGQVIAVPQEEGTDVQPDADAEPAAPGEEEQTEPGDSAQDADAPDEPVSADPVLPEDEQTATTAAQ
ncbi:MAG: hypothetical protein IJ055_05865 [Oscillospiraceae bacterium]|nr:hypothetical protein [Oscillospiraceae bacterium]